MPGSLITVRFNLENARRDLGESVRHAEAGEVEQAYKLALRARNGVFHGRRAWTALAGVPEPRMPVTGVMNGRLEDHRRAADALAEGIALCDGGGDGPPPAGLEPAIRAAESAFVEYLGYLKDEVGKRMRAGKG